MSAHKIVVTLTEKEANALWSWGLEGQNGAETNVDQDAREYAAGCRAMDKLLRAIPIPLPEES
jgi:hypothetical protein